jgi:hypothetical protein
MKHLATIQLEFLSKVARNWDDLTQEEQLGYLKRYPATKRRLTAKPGEKPIIFRNEPISQNTPDESAETKALRDEMNAKSEEPETFPGQILPDKKPVTPAVEIVPGQILPLATKPANSMSKNEIGSLLVDHDIGDGRLSYSNKKGGFVFKQSYFYRTGGSPEKFAERIVGRTKGIGLTPKIVDTSDNWHAWPKDSWFEAVISFDQMKKKEPV